jgi:hypothetical protein
MTNEVYWITKSGVKIDIDKMEIDHHRNALKMIMRNWEARRNAEIEKSLNREKIVNNHDLVEGTLDQNKGMNEILEIDEFFGDD